VAGLVYLLWRRRAEEGSPRVKGGLTADLAATTNLGGGESEATDNQLR